MRGILINPFDETIKEVNILGNIEDIYLLTECRTFDVVALSDKDDLYIDDEGLLKDNRYFTIYGRTLAGRGLIMSHDDEGNSISTDISLQEIKDVVEWLPEGHREEPYMEFKIF
tara:strand:+ start:186 stop:527 length:342 start_codon:yes stop_codon:yes gene_type:complete